VNKSAAASVRMAFDITISTCKLLRSGLSVDLKFANAKVGRSLGTDKIGNRCALLSTAVKIQTL
jgi:hypothetical protein